MKSPCPRPADLLRLLDGETTRNEEAKLRAHLDGCAACREQSAEVKQLLGDIAAPLPHVAHAATVDKVMAAIREGQATPPIKRRPTALWTGGALGFAAAAALVILVGRGLHGEDDFRPRGGANQTGLERRTGITLSAPIATRRPLRDGSVVSAQTALTAAYRNLEETRPVYLLVFGVDSQNEVHWLYPAYTDRNSDPEAIRLPFSTNETALPDSVVLESPALGKMRVFSIVAPRPLRVSAIESLKGDQLEPAALKRRWPDSHIENITVTLLADQKGTQP
jgi:hypothetical protein